MAEKKKKGGHNVILGKDGIIYVEMFGDLDRENAIGAINETVSIARQNPHTARILAVIRASSSFGTSEWRKELVGILKKLQNDPGFKKVAIFGINLAVRTIVSFVLGVARIETIKLFSDKDSALRWLKK